MWLNGYIVKSVVYEDFLMNLCLSASELDEAKNPHTLHTTTDVLNHTM